MLASKIMLSTILSLSILAPDHESPSLSKKSLELIDKIRLESEDSLSIKWSTQTQTPELLSGNLTKPSQHSPGWISYKYLDEIKILYGLRRVKEDLRIVSVEPSNTSTKVYLQRMLFNRPVCGDQLLVEIDRSGIVKRVEGSLHTDLEQKRLRRPMYAAITIEEAKQVALAFDQSLKETDVISSDSCYLPTREGIPLVHKITFEKEKRPVSFKVHSMTGRIIE
ncbi:hypothetical protein HZF08_15850 [Paenibacillus sp. CGMCC 1.16610]|uniref:FTP domain-containing protein n=1 Tax=Paenibacillus anseongense TaxID=2682845 RepID=A0ABW9UGX7_9BACL|nr:MULTISPECIES: hypothetical protein [Paenibacillus]MBA2939787.1 hypothetical protein [Paenibacillus sp. CGMCC 1.16610]MVQ39447.1 hypothetical protein [Paenibacillus anseongense]